MSRRKKGLETAFEVVVSVPQYLVDEAKNCVNEYLEDASGFSLSKEQLASNEKLQAFLVKNISEEIRQSSLEIDTYSWLQYKDVEKLFKPEITEWQVEEAAKEKAAEEKRRAEEEHIEAQLKKNGRLLSIPDKSTARAMSILRAAGITVKALAP